MADPSVIDPVKSTVDNLHEVSRALYKTSSHKTQTSFVVIDQDSITRKNRKKLQVPCGDEHIIEGIDSVVEEPLPNRKWFICRLPSAVYETDQRAYSPRMVSIGPIHYKRSCTEIMEAHKLRFLNRLLESYSEPQGMYEDLQDAMRGLEVKTRECYSEDFPDIDSDNFTRMMLLDGCFLIELLRLNQRRYQGQLADDPIFETRWMPPSLCCDILLLENQLPLFVLQQLFELTRSGDEQVSLNELALHFFESLRPGRDVMAEDVDKGEVKPHLLALFHSSFSPNASQSPANIKRANKYNTYAGKCWFYNAQLLTNSGVKLRKKSGSILDIEFNKKVLEIPTLFIDENTTIVLKNIVAYEQSDRRAAPYFMSLVVFFGNLLHSPMDAELLLKAGIIRQPENQSTEVVKVFDNLATNIVFDMDNCHLYKLIGDINIFTNTRMARLRAISSSVSVRISFVEFMFFTITTSLSIVSFVVSLRNL